MATHRDQYKSVIGKRRLMLSEGKVSVPDGEGAKVAILVPFLPALIQDVRDNREHFEAQTAAYRAYYEKKGRKPFSVMDATTDDFRSVLADTAIPNVVVAGWGSFSAIAAALPQKEQGDVQAPLKYGYLDWLHFADMATHVKLGKFVMLQCGGFNRGFNPPLPLGIVSSHANILGTPGLPHWAGDTVATDIPPDPITSEVELQYATIKDEFELQLLRKHLPMGLESVLPADVLAAVRDWNNSHFNSSNMPDLPPPVELPRPNLTQYKQYARLEVA